jgi:hypothetical protein
MGHHLDRRRNQADRGAARTAGTPGRLPTRRGPRPASPDFPTAHLLAKTCAAVNVVRSGRRLIWTDDDAIPPSGQDRDILDAAGSQLIAPDPRRGLRPHRLDKIEGFIRHPGSTRDTQPRAR